MACAHLFEYDASKFWLERPQADGNEWYLKRLFKIRLKDGLEIQPKQVTLTPYIQTEQLQMWVNI